MTDPRSRPASLLLALGLVLASAVASAADEQPSGGNTFSTPGYPTGAGQRAGTQAGQGGQSGPGDAAGMRSLQNSNSTGAGARSRAQGGDQAEANTRRFDQPPPKPGEFQKFVEAATGRLLPIFGNSFFMDAADNFSAVDNVPVSADYTVGPGDEIVLRAWGAIDIDYRSTVDRNGLLNLPKIGSFNVAGVKASELEKHLRAQIGRLYTNFNLSVSLGQLRGVRVFVVGPAQRPGVFTLASQSTLLSAVVMAGGPAPNGSMRKVLLRRDGKVISELDIYDFLVQGEPKADRERLIWTLNTRTP